MTFVSRRHRVQPSWTMKPKSNAYSHPDKEQEFYFFFFYQMMQTLFKGLMFCMNQITNK